VIEVKNLSCGYDRTVISHADFCIGTHLCILGANGVGKSTLAKALCGLIGHKGEILIDGKPLAAYTAEQRAKTITYIPPKLASFDPFIRVDEFVLMGRYPHKEPYRDYSRRDRSLVETLLAEIDLDPSRQIGELSSGQQQLLLIAQAFVQESRIIIFDEPTANLDPRRTREFYQALATLDGATQKIIITHDLNLAKKLGFAILFLSEESSELFSDPKRFFTAENLKRCYGVEFELHHSHVEVKYD
jgi:iron complex transport system ATP-binding protein